VNYVSGK